MDNPNILDMDYQIFIKIQNILEDKNIRETFLGAFPPCFFSMDFLITMDMEGQKPGMSPAKYLLMHLGSKGLLVSHLVELFEAIDLQKALVLLKNDEPLQLIEQPPSNVKVVKGAKLTLTCRASSYPLPEYQWMKDGKELLLEQDPVFSIPSVKSEDSGIYICKVSMKSFQTNEVSCLYFNPVEVSIVSPEVKPAADVTSCGKSNLQILRKSEMVPFHEHRSIANSNKEIITIARQPYINGKVPQGMSVCLTCEASSLYPVNFQWYRDGRRLVGEISSKLILNHLYPDPYSGDMKWEYQCEIFNEFDQAFSHVCVVELDAANDSTPYYPEEKIAFMVANDTYDNLEELKKPAVDVADLANLLISMDFKIFAYRNLNRTEMKNAFHLFCEMLRPDVYGLFYFAGHGFEQFGQTYLQPVDCSTKYLPEESICTEYILQSMQDMKPSLNVLLIDACRKLPPQSWELKQTLSPGKIFEGKMKNNTVYGYSTSFLYSSHESDSEANSVFVKYLKRYITQNKRIEDILMMVNRDFESDPLTKDLQYPLVKSSLSASRKLCDSVHPNTSSDTLNFSDTKRCHCKVFPISNLRTVITIKFHHHMKIFRNAIDVAVYIDINADYSDLHILTVLQDIEVDVIFKSEKIKVLPSDSIFLKHVSLKMGEKILLLRKQLLDVHKMENCELNGALKLKFCKTGRVQEQNFSVNVAHITGLNLSVNQLKSKNIEQQKIKPNLKNFTTDDENEYEYKK